MDSQLLVEPLPSDGSRAINKAGGKNGARKNDFTSLHSCTRDPRVSPSVRLPFSPLSRIVCGLRYGQSYIFSRCSSVQIFHHHHQKSPHTSSMWPAWMEFREKRFSVSETTVPIKLFSELVMKPPSTDSNNVLSYVFWMRYDAQRELYFPGHFMLQTTGKGRSNVQTETNLSVPGSISKL